MQLERFTTKAQEALQSAQRIAHEHSHQEIDGEHLLAALLAQEDGLIQPLLQKLGVPVARLSADLDQALATPRQGPGHQFLRHLSRQFPQEGPRRRRSRRPASSRTITSAPSICCSACSRRAAPRSRKFSRPTASRPPTSSRRSPNCAATSASPTRIPRTNSRRSKNTAATSPPWRARARLIPSSAATRKSAASCRC